MLASGAGSGCCTYTGGFLTPIQNPKPFGPGSPDVDNCKDLLNVAVNAILSLQIRGGATLSEITNEAVVLCPSLADVTDMEMFTALNRGARDGVLKRVNRDGQIAYMVLSAMVQLNSANRRYMRPICTLYRGRGTGTIASNPQAQNIYSRCDLSEPNALDCSY